MVFSWIYGTKIFRLVYCCLTDWFYTVPTEEPSTSDNDGGERPVRQKLRDTTITSAPNSTTADASAESVQKDDSSRASSRGRKRSFDEDEPEKKDAYSEAGEEAGHRRKRSRDSNPEDQESGDAATSEKNTGDVERKILSPKKKRSRDQVDKDEPKGQGVVEKSEEKDSSEAASSLDKPLAEGEPEKKRHRDDSRERDVATDSKVGLFWCFGLIWDEWLLTLFDSLLLRVRSPILLLFLRSAPYQRLKRKIPLRRM